MKAEKFLELFRTYESLLREHDKDYKTVEDEAEDSLQAQLRITRQMRNYLSHNPDTSFLTPSEAQIKLLESLIQKERLSRDILKQHLYTPKKCACREGDSVKEILARMGKAKWSKMPVCDETGIKLLGTIGIAELVIIYLKNEEAVLARKVYGPYGKQFICLSPETPMEQIESKDNLICCTADGTTASPFLGLLKQ